MKKHLCVLLLTINVLFSAAQNIGIGTAAPHASALLEINSTNKGLLLPRVADTSSINNPAKGLIIYSNSSNTLWYHDGVRWQQNSAGATGTDGIWNILSDSIAYTDKKYVNINSNSALTAPQANLQVGGDFVVQGKLQYSNTPPTPAQNYVMTNTAATQFIPIADSVFKISDPGGSGNYNNNMQGNVVISSTANGVKLQSNAADFGIATGDTLWISESGFPGCRTNYLYRFTNTSTGPEEMVLHSSASFIVFRSNADGANSKGFNFTLTRLYTGQPVKSIQNVGAALSFNSGNGAFAAGLDANNFSAGGSAAIAMGTQVAATGINSVVIGHGSRATKQYSLAMGYTNNALGYAAVALGSNNTASGASSATLGNGNFASGGGSLATGSATFANGTYAMSMGSNTRANGDYSIASGSGSSSGGDAATAMGYFTTATGNYSLAAGSNTLATGNASAAFGEGTSARGYASTAVGMFNVPLTANPGTVTPNSPMFIVGNGDNSTTLSNALTVIKNGNTGIGTQLVPVTRLQVDGGSDADLTAYSGYVVIGDTRSNNLVMDNNEIMARNDGAISTLYLQNDGGALITGGTASKPGGGSWSATSDARLKQNIQPYTDGLQQLQQIKPVSFNYNQQSGYDTSKQFIGVLAQELQTVAPYMVGRFNKEGTDYLNVDNTAMTYMLINAVKEQQQQIEELKSLVKKLIADGSKAP